VEGAQPDQVGPMPAQLHPPCLGQLLHRHLGLQPLQLGLRNPGHSDLPNLVK